MIEYDADEECYPVSYYNWRVAYCANIAISGTTDFCTCSAYNVAVNNGIVFG